MPALQEPAHKTAGGPIEGTGDAGEGAYHNVTQEEAVMDWAHICRVCASESLGKLDRHPVCQQRYDDWAVAIRKKYGGLEAYIKHHRLHWDGPDLPEDLIEAEASALDASDQASVAPSSRSLPSASVHSEASWRGYYHFHPSMPSSMAKTIPNDWPYGVPEDCGHYVVWCRLPIIHPSLFQTPDTPFAAGPSRDALYEAVSSDGIRGLTGIDWETLAGPEAVIDTELRGKYRVVGEHTIALLRKSREIETYTPATSVTPSPALTPKTEGVPALSPTMPKFNLAASVLSNGSATSALSPPSAIPGRRREHAVDLAERAHAWAGRYVEEYVRSKWPPEEGWECAWFCNPPHLRTVPGLSHFHVIARNKHTRR